MEEIVVEYDENTIISTSRLTKVFGKLVAVNDLHLQVMRGDVFGFLGPNGSGKTTSISYVTRPDSPNSRPGSYLWHG